MIPVGQRLFLHLKKNVIGVGYGFKEVGGMQTNEKSIVCVVNEKVESHKLKKKDIIPKEICGIKTDVFQSGEFSAFSQFNPLESIDDDLPARPGNSIGEKTISAGTFGWLPNTPNGPMIHSNCHVLAASGNADIGSEILYPGPYDGGILPDNHIANLYDFEPIKFIGPDNPLDQCKVARGIAWTPNMLAQLFKRRTRLVPVRSFDGSDFPGTPFPENYIDGAIAQPLSFDIASPEILTIGQPTGFVDIELGMEVHKHGRTTDYTVGIVDMVEFSLTVGYGEGKNAFFVDQFTIKHGSSPFASPGDSGSCILVRSDVGGTLFAGSDTMTACNHIKHHRQRFELSI